jgi:hypothetical protein
MGITVSKSGAGIPPTRRSKQAAKPERNWYIEGHVILRDGTDQIERVERNNARGREVMHKWAMKRLPHHAVEGIEVYPVVQPTKEGQPGYLRKSERPIEVIGLPGGDTP